MPLSETNVGAEETKNVSYVAVAVESRRNASFWKTPGFTIYIPIQCRPRRVCLCQTRVFDSLVNVMELAYLANRGEAHLVQEAVVPEVDEQL